MHTTNITSGGKNRASCKIRLVHADLLTDAIHFHITIFQKQKRKKKKKTVTKLNHFRLSY